MTDKESVLSSGSRLLPLALVAALAVLAFGFVGDADAHKPYPLSPPTIGTNPVVGTPLGVAPGSYHCDPACTETTYEFFRCAANTNNVSCVAVRPQSTNPFYTPTEDDIGFSLAAMVRQWTYDCDITNTNCRNSAYEVMTSATAPVKEDAPAVPVTIATSDLPDATAGIRYTQALSVSSGRPPFTWALAGGSLPPGLSLSSGGLISGLPTLAGEFTFTVRATGARRQSSTKSLTLLVKLQLSPSTLPNGVAGTAYNVPLRVVAGGTPPYTWEIQGGLLPDGLTLRPDGLLSGTPTRSGPSTFMVAIKDGRGATASYVWTLVVGWVNVSITPTTLPPGTSGARYRAVLGATGGQPPYRFLLVSEQPLPEGLTLSREGVLAGTPRAPAGNYTFTILVADATGAPGGVTYTLTLAPSRRLRATTLASATVGKRYRTTLPMRGGQRPYSFSRTGGRLPAGVRLSRSGVLLGKPMTAGRFRFRVSARDRNGFASPRLYSLVVKAPR